MPFQNLYFLAVVPPINICEEIVIIQQDLADRFKTQKSLKVIPHITIKAPFKCGANNHKDVLNWFEGLKIIGHSFFLELKDFGCFPNSENPVLYIRPLDNPSLMALQRSVVGQFIEKFPIIPVSNIEMHYNPHLTIAYRDLKREFFVTAWNEYASKKYTASFKVEKFYLFQHDGKRWNEIGSHNLV